MMRRLPIPLVALLVAGALLSACGGSAGATGTTTPGGAGTSSTASAPGSSSSSTTTASGGKSTTTTSPYGQSHVAPKSTTPTSVPKEGPGAAVPQYVSAGQQVLIEPTGFWPQLLYTNMALPVVWTNETNVAQMVVLDVIPVKSTEIPPGGQFIWQPHFGGSYTYHSPSGFHGRLILQQDTPVSVPPTTPTTSH